MRMRSLEIAAIQEQEQGIRGHLLPPSATWAPRTAPSPQIPALVPRTTRVGVPGWTRTPECPTLNQRGLLSQQGPTPLSRHGSSPELGRAGRTGPGWALSAAPSQKGLGGLVLPQPAPGQPGLCRERPWGRAEGSVGTGCALGHEGGSAKCPQPSLQPRAM